MITKLISGSRLLQNKGFDHTFTHLDKTDILLLWKDVYEKQIVQ